MIVSGLEIGVGDREKWVDKIRWVLRTMEAGEGSQVVVIVSPVSSQPRINKVALGLR